MQHQAFVKLDCYIIAECKTEPWWDGQSMGQLNVQRHHDKPQSLSQQGGGFMLSSLSEKKECTS